MQCAKLLLGVLLLFASGCGPNLVWVPDQVQPIPIADLPEPMRITNWVGRSDNGHQGGSCVHASSINTFRTAGAYDLEEAWYRNRDNGYEGPETGYGIIRKYQEQKVPFAYTSDADTSLLEEATRSRRSGIIFYYPSHCINFQEFAVLDGREVAVLLDNNFPEQYIVIDREVFEKSWEYYGGFALIPWLNPSTPRTFPRAVPSGA